MSGRLSWLEPLIFLPMSFRTFLPSGRVAITEYKKYLFSLLIFFLSFLTLRLQHVDLLNLFPVERALRWVWATKICSLINCLNCGSGGVHKSIGSVRKIKYSSVILFWTNEEGNSGSFFFFGAKQVWNESDISEEIFGNFSLLSLWRPLKLILRWKGFETKWIFKGNFLN